MRTELRRKYKNILLFTNNSNIEMFCGGARLEAEAGLGLHEVGPGEGGLARQSLLDIEPHGCQAGG